MIEAAAGCNGVSSVPGAGGQAGAAHADRGERRAGTGIERNKLLVEFENAGEKTVIDTFVEKT